ncbi:hypothetical protein [Herbiconiux daphne]|uniref:Uncharacterized protein n=1 Tax=Herbiconiux daphne TaxID=2970914 RepID=A0ABT2H6P9_9MICO|nr:hypothetical protein [Herbiconiux daphne]MCS5735588.1 hypothetical protein [Herbiconiux daphne]
MIFASTPSDPRPWFHRQPFAHSPRRQCSHPGCVVVYAPRPTVRKRAHEPNPILLEARWSDWSIEQWESFFDHDDSRIRYPDDAQRGHARSVLARLKAVYRDRPSGRQ